MELVNGNCLELMKKIPDKSVDLLICDLPYGETNCMWDTCIDMEEFWKQFRRIRKSKRVACIHFCSTKFGYSLIKSWEKGFKMDMVWKKRNKTGGLQSRSRPMRNHEMVYFFYEQAPKYNRDKYHKRIQQAKIDKTDGKNEFGFENTIDSKLNRQHKTNFDPPNPASVVEEDQTCYGVSKDKCLNSIDESVRYNGNNFEPPNPASVVEENTIMECKEFGTGKHYGYANGEPAGAKWEPVLPVSMFESEKVFIGKRHHQTEKPQDILEFFLKYWSDEGDTILDPTMGSGSTGVACKKLNRKFIGFELDETIFNVAKKRCE
jgi:DNA modification methylase